MTFDHEMTALPIPFSGTFVDPGVLIGVKFHARCSCGRWEVKDVPKEQARVLHAAHVDAERWDAVESAERMRA